MSHWTLAAVAFLLWIPTAHAQAPMREDPEKVLGFARYLLAEGDAYRAISEYQAFLFLFPGHERTAEAWFLMGEARSQEGQWNEALNAFNQSLRTGGSDGPWAQPAAMAVGETLLRAGQPESAARFFEDLGRSPQWPSLRTRALQQAAWAWMRVRAWEHAIRVLGDVSPEDPLGEDARRLSREIAVGLRGLAHRDPWVAGGLAAVLPGSGHLYTGRVKEAITSFLLNGLFIAGAVVAIRDGYPVTGGILSFFELGWYLGGIDTAARSARQFNQDQEARWIGDLARSWGMALGLEPERGSGAIRLAWRF